MATKKKEESDEKVIDGGEKASEPKGDKTPDYDAKIQNLEKKLGELGKTIGDQNEYINATSNIINTLAYNPELKQNFQNVYKQQQGMGQPNQQTQQTPVPGNPVTNAPATPTDSDKRIDEVVDANREQIIAEFEKDTGISGLDKEKADAARLKVASYLNDFGWSIKNLPLPRLKSSLDKAFQGSIGMEQLKEEGKIEGFAQATNNERGTMGHISGGAPKSQGGEEDLTPGQKKWLDKLKVDDKEGAKKTYLTRGDEKDRVAKAEKKE